MTKPQPNKLELFIMNKIWVNQGLTEFYRINRDMEYMVKGARDVGTDFLLSSRLLPGKLYLLEINNFGGDWQLVEEESLNLWGWKGSLEFF